MLGNNIQSVKTYRMVVPLNIDGTTPAPGTKFYFPETPVLENKNIVGLEGHLSTNLAGTYLGDLDINTGGTVNVNDAEASYLFFTIFDENGSEKFANVPFASICKIYSSILNANKKRVYPFVGKIKTRKSYFSFPPNLPFALTSNAIVTLTFFYNQ
jgi:hypothetical protein